MIRNIMLFCVVLLLLANWSTIIWHLEQERPLQVTILDKTVPDTSYREHKGVMWILNNLRYVNSATGSPFRYHQDYYGFFPLPEQQYAIHELPSDLGKTDLIYVTDTYGVYTADFYRENIRGKRSELIYGGLKPREVTAIANSLTPRNVLIAEFNTLATPSDPQARQQMESILGVRWTGWIGRYFSSLAADNPEIPHWLVENYEQQYNTKWKFRSSGLAFTNLNDEVVILEAGVGIGSRFNRLVFLPSAVEHYHVAKEVQYGYWFDIVEAAAQTEVLAHYHLDLTAEGEKELALWNIPAVFPAVIKNSSPYRTYYFAGDYADSNVIPTSYDAVAWRPWLGIGGITEEKKFFWQIYFPMMKQIITEIER